MAGLGRPSVENNHAGCVFPIAWPVTVWDKVLTTGEQAMTNRHADEQAIAADLAQCDLIEAYGSAKAKRQARAHRKACFAQIKAWNVEDGLDAMSADDLMAELMA